MAQEKRYVWALFQKYVLFLFDQYKFYSQKLNLKSKNIHFYSIFLF